MSRLYEISCNEEQWIIKGDRDHGYKLVNKKTYDAFNINGDVIGIEQILDDTFLVYKRIERYRWQIYRFKIIGTKSELEFKQDFEHFCFLSDDTILFDNRMIYSISQNAEVEVPHSLLHLNDISVEETLDGKKVMFVKHNIVSTELPNLYVLVIVDAVTFKPVSQAFSSLRNKLFTLTDEFTFDMLVNEDEHYSYIISNIFFEESMQIYKNGKATLFSQCPLKK
ncbi:MAG: hypothetical protein J6M60_01165 [Clostridia bacterium]|nr:hypothetical protein [Clostridia bacterium]